MTVDTESAASLCVRAALTPWLLDLTPSDNPARESRVYFIQSGSDGPIKIGKAENPMGRLAQMQVGSPIALRLLGSIPGGIADERRLHEQFKQDWLRGEWFTPSAALVRYIGRVTS